MSNDGLIPSRDDGVRLREPKMKIEGIGNLAVFFRYSLLVNAQSQL